MDQSHEIEVNASQLQFMFPFMLKKKTNGALIKKLLENRFEFFQLGNSEQEDKFYGGNVVSHRHLEQLFLPNIENMLFPESCEDKQGLRRFTKRIDLSCTIESKHIRIPFQIPSFDVIICPYQIGIMNIRVDLPSGLTLTEALEFSSEFRVMEPIIDNDQNRKIKCGEESYHKVKDFIFRSLCSEIHEFIDKNNDTSPYFGSLPFFMDERMYVAGYFNMAEDCEITNIELFRIGHLYGCDSDGKAYIGANNPKYLERYYETNVYDRWADETYYVVSDYTFSCVTKSSKQDLCIELENAMYGQHYYSILLYYYYKIVLMKLGYEQSEIEIDKDKEDIENLIIKITDFSSRYYFPEVNSSTIGKETFQMVKEVFQIDHLYAHITSTLETLYQNHEKIVAKRHNYLLQILTIYTVISGIYGMNLVIHDWKGEIKWSKIPEYSFFEWISLIVAVSGITIGTTLGVYFLKNWIREKRRNRKDHL